MNYTDEQFAQRLSDAGAMDNDNYYDTDPSSQGGFQIVEAPTAGFSAMLADGIEKDWSADQAGVAVDRKTGVVVIKTPFDVAAHSRTKTIGNVTQTADMAAARARKFKTDPLLIQARKNSEEAEARLRLARGKQFPEEAKPEDQYRHLNISAEDARDAVNEFLAGCEVSSKGKEFMTAETLFGQGNASNEVLEIRTAVRACIYAYVTQAKKKTAQIFGAVELTSFNESFLDWYYNYQHYSQGAVHTHFSDLLQYFLEKTLTGDN